MKNRFFAPTVRMIAIGLALLATVIWLQQQHLANSVHQNALLVLVLVGAVAFWMAQGHRQ